MKASEIILTQIGRVTDVSTVRTDVTMDEVEAMIDIVKAFNCVCASPMPYVTRYVVERLSDTPGTVVTGVVGFPSGADTTAAKMFIAQEMMGCGCEELDMVINVSALKSGRFDQVREDIKAVVDTAGGIPVKTILEICYLTDDEIARGSLLAVEAGATFVKTGTGWGPKATTKDTIRLIRKTIGSAAKIKAAGGIRDLDTLLDMLDAGCDRFGIGVRGAMTIFQEAYRRTGDEIPALACKYKAADNNLY